MWSRHPDDGHCRYCKRLAFFQLTIDGALSQLNENFSITTYISEVAKTSHYIEEHGLRFYLKLSLLKVFMFYDICFLII